MEAAWDGHFHSNYSDLLWRNHGSTHTHPLIIIYSEKKGHKVGQIKKTKKTTYQSHVNDLVCYLELLFFFPNNFYLGQVGHVTLTFSLLLNFLNGHQGAASETARYMKPENSDVRHTLTSLQWECVWLRVCFWPPVSLSQYIRFLNSKRPISQRSHQAIEGQTYREEVTL